MTQTEIQTGIARALHGIAPEADLNAVAPGADLRESLDIDSFDFLNFLQALHKQFGIDIPESDYAKIRTLDALSAYVAARV